MFYLDTSILAAFYLPEAVSARVQKFYSGLGEAAISALVEVEFHSALARRVRMKDLGREDALKIISALKVHVEEGLYQVLPVESREYGLARDWLATFQVPLRTLDALHLAVAFSHSLAIATADRGLAAAAEHVGVQCRLIV